METIFEVEQTNTGGFVARDAFGIDAHGLTEAEAVRLLHERIAERVRAGIRRRDNVSMIPDRPGFGIFRDNPLFDDWLATIAENRRIQDEEEARRDAEHDARRERSGP